MIKVNDESLAINIVADLSKVKLSNSIRKNAVGLKVPLVVNHNTDAKIGEIKIDSCSTKFLKATGKLLSPSDIYNVTLSPDVFLGYDDETIKYLSIYLKEALLNGWN